LWRLADTYADADTNANANTDADSQRSSAGSDVGITKQRPHDRWNIRDEIKGVSPLICREVFDDAANLFRAARRNGYTVRSGVDCLIAACALRHHLTVIHRDRDFDAIALVSHLEVKNIA